MRVISTNTGIPKLYELNGETVRSSMRREPTLDCLSVRFDRVEGDVFSAPQFHGIKEAVV
jgi:MOSC domain-containing protein YiiM